MATLTLQILDYGFTKHEADWRWRVPIALQGVFAIVALTLLLFFFPDTPRWYYARGRYGLLLEPSNSCGDLTLVQGS